MGSTRNAPKSLAGEGRVGERLSDMTLPAVLRRRGVAAVPHGFRSTFRDWTTEQTASPSYAVKVCTVGNLA